MSIKNIFTGQVKKIQQESKIDTLVIYIEEFIENYQNYKITENDVVYFLCCNSMLVPNVINILEDYNCKIINKDYLKCNYRKFDIQKILYENEISVPNMTYETNIEKINFPIFCKENRHEGIIFQAYNKITLEKFFEKFNILDYYFEEVIEKSLVGWNEIKIYFVDGKVFSKDDTVELTEEIKELCNKIESSFDGLEVFSVDIIQTVNKKNYVIDLNSAAGFYLSDDGRKYFLQKIFEK